MRRLFVWTANVLIGLALALTIAGWATSPRRQFSIGYFDPVPSLRDRTHNAFEQALRERYPPGTNQAKIQAEMGELGFGCLVIDGVLDCTWQRRWLIGEMWVARFFLDQSGSLRKIEAWVFSAST
jgi:hypothetical protein